MPIDRPGGPWWYRDYTDAYSYLNNPATRGMAGLENFFNTIRPFIKEAYKLRGDSLVHHDPMEIAPPEEAELFYRTEED